MRLAVPFFQAILSLSLIVAAWALSFRLTPDSESLRRERSRWLRGWFLKGMALPVLVWLMMNIGLSWRLQPFMPQIQAVKNKGGAWELVYWRYAMAGLLIVSSYWAALTLAWVLNRSRAALEGDLLADFKALCWTVFLGMLVPAAGIAWLGGWPALGVAALAILIPMAGYAPVALEFNKMPPMYSRAVARMKFGKYSEAEWEIIRQLEKREDDFEGWMMLAELYATHFHDLAEAEQTILEICDQPRTTPPQLSQALHRLADWQLSLGENPDAARRCLQMIRDRLPRTHLAHMAELRMSQLPRSSDDLREQKIARPIPLPALGDALDRAPDPNEPEPDRKTAAQAANACVAKLERDPNDVAAREKLARLFAEKLDRVDLALEQVNLLLDMPEQAESKRAEWLGMVAAWQLKYLQDPDAARQTLERLVRLFPSTPQALAARRRIRLIDVEFQR